VINSPEPRTTHTVEMSQIDELNRRLSEGPSLASITATQLGVEGASIISGPDSGRLPGTAVLDRLCWDGPPQWPYIHAHFSPRGAGVGSLVVDLHTGALQELSHRLHLHQTWGL
jgi:hypothetical protein